MFDYQMVIIPGYKKEAEGLCPSVELPGWRFVKHEEFVRPDGWRDLIYLFSQKRK